MNLAWLGLLVAPALMLAADLGSARDRQDKATLQAAVAGLAEAAGKSPNLAAAQYRLALAE